MSPSRQKPESSLKQSLISFRCTKDFHDRHGAFSANLPEPLSEEIGSFSFWRRYFLASEPARSALIGALRSFEHLVIRQPAQLLAYSQSFHRNLDTTAQLAERGRQELSISLASEENTAVPGGQCGLRSCIISSAHRRRSSLGLS